MGQAKAGTKHYQEKSYDETLKRYQASLKIVHTLHKCYVPEIGVNDTRELELKIATANWNISSCLNA